MEFKTLLILAVCIFIYGYDMASFTIMKKIDSTYRTRNMLFVGYNSFKVWQSYRKANKDD